MKAVHAVLLLTLFCVASAAVGRAQVLIGSTENDGAGHIDLVEIDPASGAITATVGCFSVGSAAQFSGLTYHTPSGRFILISGGSGVTPQIAILDPATMSATIVPITGLPPGLPDAAGLEFWDAQGRLMITAGTGFIEGSVAEIDLAGNVINGPVDLAVGDRDYLGESATGQLIAIDYNEFSNQAAYDVEDPFGALTVTSLNVSPGVNSGVFGSAFSPTTGDHLALAGGLQLLRVEPTGYVAIGSGFAWPERILGLAFADPQVTFASNYCTAGTSASGCQATLSTSGTPSSSAASGFTVTAANIEGNKDGLFFFGTNGRQAQPWGNGTSFQCVAPPVKRLGLVPTSGTNGLCDGIKSQDFNAAWAATPAKNPGPGALVQAQLWYRDLWNTSNQKTSLSDAIEFCVHP